MQGMSSYTDAAPDERAITYRTYVNADGVPKVTGGRDLHDSQTYSRTFAREVRRLWRKNCTPGRRPQCDQTMEGVRALLHMHNDDDLWADAEMEDVLAYLRGR